MPEHIQLCSLSSPEHDDESVVVVPQAIAKALDSLTCGYCAKSGFQSTGLLQHHITQSCTLAKPFGRNEESVSSNQEQIQDEQRSVPIQGRLRRQSDAQVLKVRTQGLKKPIAPFCTTTKLPVIPNARPAAVVRARAKAQQTIARVAISGAAMTRVHELSQQQPADTPAVHCISNDYNLTSRRIATRSRATASSTGLPSISIRPQRLGR